MTKMTCQCQKPAESYPETEPKTVIYSASSVRHVYEDAVDEISYNRIEIDFGKYGEIVSIRQFDSSGQNHIEYEVP
jgi:hypothetical protein